MRDEPSPAVAGQFPGRRRWWLAMGVTAQLWASPAAAQSDPEPTPHDAPTESRAPKGSASAPAVGIVAPQLLHFEPADYPETAARERLEAMVTLRLTLDAEGRVTAAEVVTPAGHGFDEAAVSAVHHFRFAPATRAGVPVAARILYRYAFRLEAAPMAAQGQPTDDSPAFGELRGKIVAGAPPTPLAGIAAQITSPGAPPIRVTTAADGTWILPKVPPGDYTVEIAAGGYRHVTQHEVVLSKQVTEVTYHLETSNELPLEVSVRGTPLEREITHYEIPRTELLRVPGTFGDAVHAVEALPSVARPPGLSGALLVRGSAPRDTLVHIEGTEVPYVFHIGGLSSVIPGEMLDRLEFYPSNFSARYGRATGGIVEVRMRRTNPDAKFHGSAQVDLINARGNVEGPLGRGWSFMGGARASYMDRWLAPMLRDGGTSKDGLPRYYDYQLYLERQLPRNGMYRIGFFGAYDTVVPIEANPVDWTVPERNSFLHLQSQLRLPLTDFLDFKASWSIGRNRNQVSEDDRSTDTKYTLGTWRSELAVKTGGIGMARVGADIQYAPFSVKALTDERSTGGELASVASGAPRLVPYDLRGVYLRPAAYAEYEFVPHRRIDVTTGLRIDYTRDTDRLDVAPRLAARSILVNYPQATVIKGGVGLFYQPPDPSHTLAELGTADLTSSRATHFMLGFEQQFLRHVTLSVEGFTKELRDLVVTRQDGSGRELTANTGRGRVIGADLWLRYHSDERFFGWLTYTLSRSTRQDSDREPEELYRYDQTHVLNVLGSYRLGRGWEIGARFRYTTGRVYRACTGGYFDSASGNYRCYAGQTQKRLAPFHQLDLRVEKSWALARGRVSVYLDLINAYFHYSPDRAVPNYDYSAYAPLSLSLPLIPSFGLRGEL